MNLRRTFLGTFALVAGLALAYAWLISDQVIANASGSEYQLFIPLALVTFPACFLAIAVEWGIWSVLGEPGAVARFWTSAVSLALFGALQYALIAVAFRAAFNRFVRPK